MPRVTDPETWRSLSSVRPLYVLPDDPLADEVLIPGFQNAVKVDCMAGFFSSDALADLAPGLATYINVTRHSLRLIISPVLRQEDQAAIKDGIESAEAVARACLEDMIITEDLLQQHTLKCLSWLMSTGRIEIRIALMPDALFHPKVWLFHVSDGVMAVHGSSNVTIAGLRKNVEQIAVSQSWSDPNQRYVSTKLGDQFQKLWSNEDDSCIVVPIPQAIRERLLQDYRREVPPTEDDLRALYRKAARSIKGSPDKPPVVRRVKFTIPTGLKFNDGEFAHQGRAVDAWCGAGYRGVLEMATGSGKTITAMLCAHRLNTERQPLLIVVAAPYVPLIQQWCDEIIPFGLKPVNLTICDGNRGRAKEIGRVARRIEFRRSRVEVIIVSHRTLCDSGFKLAIENIDCATLLIADEVHNLGSEGFITNPPSFFDYRLGLSATPVRQYDADGTTAMFQFFGQVVFRFTLAEAIDRCLVPYDYYVHRVDLTPDEMDQWTEITARIKANAWRQESGEPDEFLVKLFRDRHSVLESAENKISALEEALQDRDLRNLRHVLIYASDKAPEQLNRANSLLRKCGIPFHQLTYEETVNRRATARIVDDFREGTLRVLTAKRVLDEGVNIPQVQTAFVLASTTVERQWIQRRGRLLRTCRDTGKTHAEIHDFVVWPPAATNMDDEARAVIRGELTRIQEFAKLARNAARTDGPLNVTQELLRTIAR